MQWRAMQPADLSAVVALSTAVHLHHPEDAWIFAERLSLAAAGCFVLGTPVAGYAISHPWRLTGPPALDTLLGALPVAPECWHLHDIVVAMAERGAGHGAAGLGAVLTAAEAAGFRTASLVAIDGQAARWERLGFKLARCEAGAALATYGAGAAWMTRAC
jgi:ribosomal protein S18 acetylase RimI-like enzyme